jgi:hypothetical protein
VDAVELFFRFQFLHTVRTRIVLQTKDVEVDLFSNGRIEFPNVLLGRRSNFNAVSQGLIPQFLHQLS